MGRRAFGSLSGDGVSQIDMLPVTDGSEPRSPLDGFLVIDFTRVIAGPFLTQTLGDLGAEVIKIENPHSGDDLRHYRPQGWKGDSPGFIGLNRNKKSVALDISTAAGKAACIALAEKADVLVENFRPDVMARHGLGYEMLAAVNPRLVYCSISGYGHTSPFRMVAGYDPIAQAETGMMYLTGPPDIEPQKAGGSIGDTFTSLNAGMGVMAALMARERTGQGQHVDVSLFDSMLSVQGYAAQWSLMTGDNQPRLGNKSAVLVPMGLFYCADGPIMLVVGNDRQFERFCNEVLERPDLLEDPRYQSIASRLDHRASLEVELNEVFSENSREHWVNKMRKAGVPAGSVRDPGEAVRSPEAAGRNMLWEGEYNGRAIELVGSAINLSNAPLAAPRPVPTLGQHTEQVLRDLLDYDDAQVAELLDS